MEDGQIKIKGSCGHIRTANTYHDQPDAIEAMKKSICNKCYNKLHFYRDDHGIIRRKVEVEA